MCVRSKKVNFYKIRCKSILEDIDEDGSSCTITSSMDAFRISVDILNIFIDDMTKDAQQKIFPLILI